MTRIRFLVPLLVAMLSGCTAIVGGRQQDPECLADSDCPILDICDGPRVCDEMTHSCVSANTPLDCNDSEPCTADTCDPSTTGGCVHTLADADMDGYAPGVCADPGTYEGGDCDDSNTGVNPGATEDCSTTTVDDNCNGSLTDYPATLTCYADDDGDGFHDPSDSTTAGGCGCPTGYIQPNAIGPDCADGVASANPSNTGYFTKPYCRNSSGTVAAYDTSTAPYWACPAGYSADWDYNCNDTDDQQYTGVSSTCYIYSFTTLSTTIVTSLSTIIYPLSPAEGSQNKALTFCSPRWDSNYVSSAPACGASARQWTCLSNSSCSSNSSTQTQPCR